LRVDHQVQPSVGAWRPGDHQIVNDAALGVEQLGVTLTAGRETKDVGRAQTLERARGRRVVGPIEPRLAHVRNVEQSGARARVQVFCEDARPVVDRHVVAGERRHPGAELDVQRVKRRQQDRGFRHRFTRPKARGRPLNARTPRCARAFSGAPSVS
jgi:hypothetical protein